MLNLAVSTLTDLPRVISRHSLILPDAVSYPSRFQLLAELKSIQFDTYLASRNQAKKTRIEKKNLEQILVVRQTTLRPDSEIESIVMENTFTMNMNLF